MLSNGLGRALKVVHECYRFARDRKLANGNPNNAKASIFSPVATGGSSSTKDNSHVKELFWCYNYLTVHGSWCTEALIAQHEKLILFFLDDVAKEDESVDLSPALMTLCTMLDQTTQDSSAAESTPVLTQSVYNFVTNAASYQVLLDSVFKQTQGKFQSNGLAKHSLYLLSNALALCHGMQDALVTSMLKQTLLNSPYVHSLLKLEIPSDGQEGSQQFAGITGDY